MGANKKDKGAQKDRPIRFLFANGLKPAYDSRTYEKIGATLLCNFNGTFYFFGKKISIQKAAAKEINTNSIVWLEQELAGRFGWKRIGLGFIFFKYLVKIKPTIVIVGAPELLPIAVVYQLFSRQTKVVYDLRVNHSYRIIYSKLSILKKQFYLSLLVIIEKFPMRFVDGIILAEACYQHQLKLPKKSILVAENKFKGEQIIKNNFQLIENPLLIISGTLGSAYGTFRAIEFSLQLYPYFPHRLLVIGYAAKRKDQQRLLQLSDQSTHLTVKGGSNYVPHPEIMKAMAKADLLVLPYTIDEIKKDIRPTKVFEALGLSLPLAIPPNPFWEDWLEDYGAAITIPFHELGHEMLEKVAKTLREKIWYRNSPEKEIAWESQDPSLVEFFDNLLP